MITNKNLVVEELQYLLENVLNKRADYYSSYIKKANSFIKMLQIDSITNDRKKSIISLANKLIETIKQEEYYMSIAEEFQKLIDVSYCDSDKKQFFEKLIFVLLHKDASIEEKNDMVEEIKKQEILLKYDRIIKQLQAINNNLGLLLAKDEKETINELCRELSVADFNEKEKLASDMDRIINYYIQLYGDDIVHYNGNSGPGKGGKN